MKAAQKVRENGADSPITIVSADWIIPILRPPVRGGAIAVQHGTIIDLGNNHQLQDKYDQTRVMHLPGALMPGLVNAHTHLELSVLGAATEIGIGQGFVDWVRALLQKRAEMACSREDILRAADIELQHQKNLGVIFVADIGNEFIPELQSGNQPAWPGVYRMVEMIAPNKSVARDIRQQLSTFDDTVHVTAHAPYSTVPEILRLIKKRCCERCHLFSIHTAETSDEPLFISSNSGPFREFLDERGAWDGAFNETGIYQEGTVEHFSRLGLLDNKTLLVHCVQVSDREIELVALSQAHVCLCPGSNKFLGVGRAPVVKMVKSGILPALGTDSAASNPVLNLWREMKLLAEEHDSLPHEMILGMATLGGAKALGLDSQIGSLEIGRTAACLSIQDDFVRKAESSDALLGRLVTGGGPDRIQWLSIN